MKIVPRVVTGESLAKVRRSCLMAGVAFSALTAASPASAQNINTTPDWNGVTFISSWGVPNTATYGQTITPTGQQQFLQSFTFNLFQQSGTPSQFQAFVFEWNPTTQRIVGNALFTSGVMTAPSGASFVPVTVNTGAVRLNSGTQYVLFFTTSTISGQANGTYRYGSLTNNTTYPGGQFVFQNNGTNFGQLSTNQWSFIGQDLAFLANFFASVQSQLPIGAPLNPTSVGIGIDKALFAGLTIPNGFVNLFTLTPTQLQAALTQLSGEAATGAQTSAFQLMNSYLDLLTDPFSDTRVGFNGPAGQPMGYAQQQSQRQPLPADAASAYAKVLKAPAAPPPETRKWDVWAAGFGGYNRTDGDAVTVGSSNLTSRAYGYAAGFDYRFTPDSAIGFSLAGGLTNWGLASALGGGSSDVFQAGVYGWKRWNNFYVSGAIAGAIHDVDTNRTVTVAGVDTLRGNTDAQNIAGRLELGYRLIAPIVDFTPYGAAQVQHYRLNGYTETAAFGSNQFALSYAEQSSTMTRTELGARLDKRYAVMGDSVLNLFGRAAWVHDWNRDSALTPTFATLPLTTFTVTGANPDENLALVTAGAELLTRSRWALMAKFAGEFGGNTQTYTGTGRIRYTW